MQYKAGLPWDADRYLHTLYWYRYTDSVLPSPTGSGNPHNQVHSLRQCSWPFKQEEFAAG